MKIAFFETRDKEREGLSNLLSDLTSAGHELVFYEERFSADAIDKAQGVEVLSVFIDSEVRQESIDALPGLKLIATRSTGFDHIDVKYAESKGIKVVTVPAYGARTVAEFAFGLVLSLSRNIYRAVDQLKENEGYKISGLQGFDLFEKTIGIVGTGRIGKNMARIARGFGMKILATDIYPDNQFAEEECVEYVPLSALLASSDVISIHTPYNETTHHLLNAENMKMMKRGALLINTARGEIVETEALLAGLRSGIIGGAGLDVLEGEKKLKEEAEFFSGQKLDEHDIRLVAEDHVLMGMPNVIITPHIAFFSNEAETEIIKSTAGSIKNFIKG